MRKEFKGKNIIKNPEKSHEYNNKLLKTITNPFGSFITITIKAIEASLYNIKMYIFLSINLNTRT